MEDVMVNVNKTLTIAKAEEFHEYRKWANELPALHFDKEWDVKIIPPFAGAIIRFWINYNIKNGILYVTLYEKINPRPDFKRIEKPVKKAEAEEENK